MNDTRLLIYLDDHLALMVGEVELIGRCWRSNQGTTLGEFLQKLECEVQTQEAVARDVIGRLGSKEGIDSKLKQRAAWSAEKLGRFKLNDSLLSYSALSRVVEFEALALPLRSGSPSGITLMQVHLSNPCVSQTEPRVLLSSLQLHCYPRNASLDTEKVTNVQQKMHHLTNVLRTGDNSKPTR